jgi:hypothetical protein
MKMSAKCESAFTFEHGTSILERQKQKNHTHTHTHTKRKIDVPVSLAFLASPI